MILRSGRVVWIYSFYFGRFLVDFGRLLDAAGILWCFSHFPFFRWPPNSRLRMLERRRIHRGALFVAIRAPRIRLRIGHTVKVFSL